MYIVYVIEFIIKSAVRRKVLALFALNPAEEIYSAQVAKEIEELPYTVGLELQALVKGGLLERRDEGRRVYYRWNPKHPLSAALKSLFEKARETGDEEIRSISDLQRRRDIERNLKQVLEGLKKYYDPEKVILFGSAVSGRIGPNSDIDLVVIKKTSAPYFDRVKQLAHVLDYTVDIDFLVYTPEEFQMAVSQRRFFQEEIVKKGKVIYEKAA